MDLENMRYVGIPLQRVKAREIAKGILEYSEDIRLEGARVIRVLRSSRSHARVKNVDSAEALRMPGVLGVLTAKDIPGLNRHGVIIQDQPLLADGKVRFVGEPIGIIVAESEEIGEEALARVVVEYEDLPVINSPEGALAEGAPILHAGGNVLARRRIKKGNVEKGFARSEIIVEKTYITPLVEHSYLELDAGGGYLEKDGRFVIFASTQNPHYDRRAVAEILGIEEERVRIIQAPTGGGFGSKLDLTVQGFIALALHHFREPVRLAFTREEAFLATSKRHPSRIRLKSGIDKNGKLMALEARLVFDTGAYSSYGVPIATRAAIHITGPYEIPHVDVDSMSVYTNNPVSGAMRGVAIVQTTFACESQMDLMARELGMDPLEFRKINAMRPGSITCTGQRLNDSVGILETLSAIEPYYKAAKKAIQEGRCHKYHRSGIGLGCMWYGIGNMSAKNPSRARIDLYRDGRIVLCSGAADIGQGSSTILCQIAHEILGLEPGYIKSKSADTAFTPDAGSTSASRQTYISGNAVKGAAEKAAHHLKSVGAELLGVHEERVHLEDGFIVDSENGEHKVSIPDVAEKICSGAEYSCWEGCFDPVTTPLDPETGQGIPFATYTFASHLAILDVDVLTGEVDIRKVVAAHDVGRAINPQSVQGQIQGGVGMGIGFALMERFVPLKTTSLSEYYIPTSLDMPEIETIIIECPEPTGPFGAKGMGEPALAPTPPAIMNAIADAIGERIYRVPATSEVVREALEKSS